MLRKSVLRNALRIFGVLAVVIAVAYGVIDWRGNRAWKKYLADSGLKSEQLDLQHYVPAGIPDEENFAAIDAVKLWFLPATENHPFNSDHFSKALPTLTQNLSNPEQRRRFEPLDLTTWQFALTKLGSEHTGTGVPSSQISRADSASAVLAALQDDDEVIEALRSGSIRPRCVYPVDYRMDDPWGTLLPEDGNIKALAQRLELMACAEMAEKETGKAFDDAMLILHLSDSLTNDPLVISYLVRCTAVADAIQPIREGIIGQRWSDSQLQQFEAGLLQQDFVRSIDTPLRTERASVVLTADLTRKRGVNYLARIATSEPTLFGGVLGNVLDCMIPSGWFGFEKANYCRMFDDLFAGTIDPISETISPHQLEVNRQEFDRQFSSSAGSGLDIVLGHLTFARMFLPTLPKTLFRGAIAQTAANEAALACALERYRLSQGEYPTSLESLEPRWIARLPKDIVADGGSYHYRRTSPNLFVLYSVGWDGVDDHGTPGNLMFDQKGDWVW
jgi:hypothetical protein